MCTPGVLVAAGSYLQAEGQYKSDETTQEILEFQEQSVKQQADANAAAFESQAEEEEIRASQARKRGRFIQRRLRKQIQGEIGTTKTALAVTGVDIGAGSAQRVLNDQFRSGVMDQIIFEQNRSLEVWGYKKRAERFRVSADLVRQRGKDQAKIFGNQADAVGSVKGIKRFATILSGFGQASFLEIQSEK